MNILTFDIETIPDVASGRRLYNLNGLSDKEVAEVMFSRRRQETDGASDFLRLHLHKVVAISVLLSTNEEIKVWSLGDIDSDEADIVKRFFEGIERYTPRIVHGTVVVLIYLYCTTERYCTVYRQHATGKPVMMIRVSAGTTI